MSVILERLMKTILDKLNRFEAGQFLRDIIFGINDAVLTNLGIIAGFTVALKDNHYIILACLIDIFISAFSMSFGTYMSRTSEQDFLETKLTQDNMLETKDAMGHPIMASVMMWISYVISGLITIAPFFFGLNSKNALVFALIIGISIFFVLGLIKGALTKTKIIRSGLEFLAFGTVAAVIGLVVGQLANRIR